MTLFNEEDLEKATLEWLKEMGYEIAYGPDIAPNGSLPERKDYQTVILKERLYNALSRINPQANEEQLQEAIRLVTTTQHPSLIMNNRESHRLITEGIDVTVHRDGEERTEKIWLIDRREPHNNDFLAVNQFTVIEGSHHHRADIVVFINGLPMVVFELKSSSNENVGISQAYHQLQVYKETIPSLFNTNAFMVISDGLNARAGTLTASEERFMRWRTIDGKELAPNTIPQIEVLIRGMFKKETLIDIISHFILFQDEGHEVRKILAAYHQYHAVNKAIEKTYQALSESGDRKIGVIWHTQGSGKSLTMIFYAGKLVLEFDNPTIVVITDRNDLDNQLYQTFSKSVSILRQEPAQAETKEHLKELLSVNSGGIVFTTIQKFAPENDEDALETYTDRKNVIVIADEAHRSQYGFEAEVSKRKGTLKYGFAKYLRDALPNASFIGFTGTPVELEDRNTPAVFGNYIDIYDMTQSVEDGATVKIYYESRIIKLGLSEGEAIDMDEEIDELTEGQALHEKERLKSKWTRLEALAGAEKRVQKLAQDIVEHFEKRQEAMFGKAMIVVMSRRIAIDLYKAIVALRPEWHSDDDDKGVIKVVMTSSAGDPKDWYKFTGNKRRRDYLAKRMKDINDSLKLVIVRDMWLTGFDVPCMHTIYIDKPMKGHNLMQAIARVNRVFRDKPGGLVVDYIGIAESLKEALKQYAERDREQAGIDTELAVKLMEEKYEVIKDMLHGHDYQKFFSDKPTQRIQAIVETVDYVIGLGEEGKKDFIRVVTELSKAHALCSTAKRALELGAEIAFFKAVKAGIIKLISDDDATPQRKTGEEVDAQVQQLISKSIISEGVVDIYESLGLEKPDISILSDAFLQEVKNLKHKNVAVELLNRLIKGRIKVLEQTNLVQSEKFSKKLLEALDKYHKRGLVSAKIIEELIELAKEINKAFKRGEENNLSEEEIAFYDALAHHETAKEVMGDEKLRLIAHELTKSVKANMSTDWNLRESARAKMRVTVKRLLKKYGYPPDLQQSAVDTVVKHVNGHCKIDSSGHFISSTSTRPK